MPHEKTETVYYFDELDDAAKERAREWYREGNLDCYEWWDGVYDYCKDLLTLLGFDFKPKAAKIYFSGFWSQGDGACFDNVSWSAEDVKAEEARKEFVASSETEAQRAVRSLIDDAEELSKTYPELSGRIDHRGHYQHSHCTDIRADVDESGFEEDEDGNTIVPLQYESGDYEEDFAEFARDCMDWVYRCLERECEYLNSDEVVDESIRCNEYEFYENGDRA